MAPSNLIQKQEKSAQWRKGKDQEKAQAYSATSQTNTNDEGRLAYAVVAATFSSYPGTYIHSECNTHILEDRTMFNTTKPTTTRIQLRGSGSSMVAEGRGPARIKLKPHTGEAELDLHDALYVAVDPSLQQLVSAICGKSTLSTEVMQC